MNARAEWIPRAEAARWREALAGLDHGFAHLPEYSAAAECVTGFAAGLWAWRSDHGRAAVPLLRRPSPLAGFDLATPLGFSGFAITGDSSGLMSDWQEFWRGEGALAAYVQLAPLQEAERWNQQLADAGRWLVPSRECWVWDLGSGEDDLAAGMSSKHRQLLHKWQREAPELCWDRAELVSAFNRLYADFIERRSVGESYRYTPSAIAALADATGALWLGVRGAAGTIEAVTLFLFHGGFADSFLNAATPDGRRHSRGLYWLGARRLRELGVRRLNLGGGVRDGDELSAFKQRLGARSVPTLALRQVFDDAAYARTCALAGVVPDATGRFPPWR